MIALHVHFVRSILQDITYFLQISISNFVGKWNTVILVFNICRLLILFYDLFYYHLIPLVIFFAFLPVVELIKAFHYSFSTCGIWKPFFQWLFLFLTCILNYVFYQCLKLIIIFILLLNTSWVQHSLITHQVAL